MTTLALPVALLAVMVVVFIVAERVLPGRQLPNVPGWYVRMFFLNACQLGIVLLAGATWNTWLSTYSFLHLSGVLPPAAEGFAGWFFGTFVFYWWHRLRHESDFCWRVFHQIHHSPARIETLSSFYKHPVEIVANSVLTSLILYTLMGASVEAAAWYNLFAATGEMVYHSNLRTPHWVGYFLQRPEHHSVHHQLDVHDFNYGDITWWDRLFGTFRDVDGFAPRCGFPGTGERRLGAMLCFVDVYDESSPQVIREP